MKLLIIEENTTIQIMVKQPTKAKKKNKKKKPFEQKHKISFDNRTSAFDIVHSKGTAPISCH